MVWQPPHPDGRLIAYIDAAQQPAETTRVMVLRLADGAVFEVTDTRANARSPLWSPDSRTLYFVWNRAGAADLWRRRLAADRAPSGPPTRVATGVEIRQASASLDGARLFYVKGRWIANVWRVPLGLPRPAVWNDATQVTFEQAFIEFVDVSPDGRSLAFSPDRLGNQDLWSLDLDTGALTQLTSDQAAEWAPRWSRDGQWIAFYASRTGEREIYVMAADRPGDVRQLTSSPGLDATPDWSPDGRWIAYRSERTGLSGIRVVG